MKLFENTVEGKQALTNYLGSMLPYRVRRNTNFSIALIPMAGDTLHYEVRMGIINGNTPKGNAPELVTSVLFSLPLGMMGDDLAIIAEGNLPRTVAKFFRQDIRYFSEFKAQEHMLDASQFVPKANVSLKEDIVDLHQENMLDRFKLQITGMLQNARFEKSVDALCKKYPHKTREEIITDMGKWVV